MRQITSYNVAKTNKRISVSDTSHQENLQRPFANELTHKQSWYLHRDAAAEETCSWSEPSVWFLGGLLSAEGSEPWTANRHTDTVVFLPSPYHINTLSSNVKI